MIGKFETISDLLLSRQAYADVINGWKWKTFTVLYEDEDGLIRLQELLQLSITPGYKIIIRQLPDSDDYR